MTIKWVSYLVICSMIFSISYVSAQNENKERQDLTFQYSFSQPEVIKHIEGDTQYYQINLEDLPRTRNSGDPRLPVKPIYILIPQEKTIDEIIVSTSSSQDIGLFKNIEEGPRLFAIGSSSYFTPNIQTGFHLPLSRNTENNPETHQLLTYQLHLWRGYQILSVVLHPVVYDSISNILSYYPDIDFTIKTTDQESENHVKCYQRDLPRIQSLVENPSCLSTYDISPTQYMASSQYIIITSEEFANAQGSYTFQDLIQSKIDKGMTADIITIEEILDNNDYLADGKWGDNNPDNPFYQEDVSNNISLFNDKSARIRNYIRYAYTELGTEYVLLGGDADEILPSDIIMPYRGLFADEEGLPLFGMLDYEEDDIPSDIYYACLDGNFNDDQDEHYGESKDFNDQHERDEADLMAEIWIGRACVDSIEEIENFVNKTLWYDQTDDEYVSEILFLGEYLGFPGESAYGGNYKDYMEEQVNIPSRFNINKIYDREETWNFLDIHEHLCSTSYHFINHDGHGNEYYIMKASGDGVRALTNDKPFFIYSHSCLTGSFDNYDCYRGYQVQDCIAEILTCEIPYGAFACILNARFGLGSEGTLDSPSGAYDESFYRAVFEEGYRELGKANHYSKEDHIWEINENGMRWCYYQTNLFGDPSLIVKNLNQKPLPPTIQGNNEGKAGEPQEFSIVTTDPDDDMLSYFIDWGDGTNTGWIGPSNNGEEMLVNHTWSIKKSYTIKVKARDSAGDESDWSTFKVSMPKSVSVFTIIQEYYQFLIRIISNIYT